MPDPSELALMQLIAKGDPLALRVLFDSYAGRVLAIARGVLASQQGAEEVVQDTFLQVWLSARSYEPARGTVASWLATIARSRALDHVRREKQRADYRDASTAEEPHHAPVPLPSELVEERQDRERLMGCLNELPPEQREVLELAYFEGLSHRDIAQRTGLPLGTVKTRVRLALKRLAAASVQSSPVAAT